LKIPAFEQALAITLIAKEIDVRRIEKSPEASG